MLYADLSVQQNLVIAARLLDKTLNARTLEQWSLIDYASQCVRTLSQGIQTRVALARASLQLPKLVLLDEPSAFLDSRAVVQLEDQLQRWKKQGAAIVVATHDLARLGSLASRILLLDQGRLIADSAISPATISSVMRRAQEVLA
jgi:ABC-type multidrug transport system ATPase subunit